MKAAAAWFLFAPAIFAAANPFAGRWDMTVQEPGGTYPAWLEMIDSGQAAAQLRIVGRVGGAKRIKDFSLAGDRLTFSTQEWFGSYERVDYEIRVTDRHLSGAIRRENGTAMGLEGVPAPELKRAEPRWGAPVALFNGEDLTGWRPRNPRASQWRASDGRLVNERRGTNLLTTRTLRDFKLHVEFMCAQNCNSGVYLRGRYEVQIELGSAPHSPDSATGSVYLYLAPSVAAPLALGEWHRMDMMLVGRTVTVALNGQTVIDRQEIPGPTGGALDSDEAASGPIVLQGDHGGVTYRNIILTPEAE